MTKSELRENLITLMEWCHDSGYKAATGGEDGLRPVVIDDEAVDFMNLIDKYGETMAQEARIDELNTVNNDFRDVDGHINNSMILDRIEALEGKEKI